METIQKTEYKCYVLNLAEMHGGVDKSVGLAVFDDIEKLKSYYNSQLAEQPYKDKGYNSYAGSDDYEYHKVFKKGSLLEWYNPMNNFDVVSYQNAGFGGITEYWTPDYPSQEAFRIPFNPSP